MDEEASDPELAEQPLDPISIIHNAIAEATDDGSLCIGYALVAEYLEDDGRTTISVINSPMPPWHMYGLLTYGREWSEAGHMVPVDSGLILDDDDDDF